MHKHLWEYVRDTSEGLDALIAELRAAPTAGLLPAAFVEAAPK
jgi:hypothetical protein